MDVTWEQMRRVENGVVDDSPCFQMKNQNGKNNSQLEGFAVKRKRSKAKVRELEKMRLGGGKNLGLFARQEASREMAKVGPR